MTELEIQHHLVATGGRFLWHPPVRTAVICDLHLGAAESRRAVGIMFPDSDDKRLREDWLKLSQRVGGPGRIVIAGDLFDAPEPGSAAISLARDLIQSLPANVAIELVPGNHDPSENRLTEIFAGTRLRVIPHAEVAGYTILHGHLIGNRANTARGLIVGHQHPAVILSDRVQSAKMICFAWGPVNVAGITRQLIVLPAFSRAPLGSNLLTDRNWILDLPRPKLSEFRIGGIVEKRTGDTVLDFGFLADLP